MRIRTEPIDRDCAFLFTTGLLFKWFYSVKSHSSAPLMSWPMQKCALTGLNAAGDKRACSSEYASLIVWTERKHFTKLISQRKLNGILLYSYHHLEQDNGNPILLWWKPPLSYELALMNQPGCAQIFNGVTCSISWVCSAACADPAVSNALISQTF